MSTPPANQPPSSPTPPSAPTPPGPGARAEHAAHGASPGVPIDPDRLARLEEATMFNEHTLEDLSGQLVDLFQKLQQVTRRMEMLEGRLGRLQDRLDEPDPGPEKPPHSA